MEDGAISNLAVPRPSSAPPLPPFWMPGGDGGGGEPFRVPWWLWVLAAVITLAWLILAYGLVLVLPRRPLPTLTALGAAATAAWFVSRAPQRTPDHILGRIYACGIGGGIFGELAHYLILGVPPSVSGGLGWLLTGAVGIGGGIGLGLSIFVSMGWGAGILLWTLWRLRNPPAA